MNSSWEVTFPVGFVFGARGEVSWRLEGYQGERCWEFLMGFSMVGSEGARRRVRAVCDVRCAVLAAYHTEDWWHILRGAGVISTKCWLPTGAVLVHFCAGLCRTGCLLRRLQRFRDDVLGVQGPILTFYHGEGARLALVFLACRANGRLLSLSETGSL